MAEALASSLSSLSLSLSLPSSLPSRKSSLSGLKLPSFKPAPPPLSLRASHPPIALPSASSSSSSLSPPAPEPASIKQYIKAALPGGFAAQRLLGTGRRKTAVARVCLIEGTGQIIINGRTAKEYLQGNPLWLQAVKFPLASLGYETKYDAIIKAEGGGLSAQAQAILLGIARALCVANAANREPLKKQGLLTRDSRRVERKKYGLHKARKAPQFSKR